MIEKKKSLYYVNGQHVWDKNDTLLVIYYYKIVENNTTVENDRKVVDFDSVEKQLESLTSLNSVELSENIIGCSAGALKAHSLIIDFYMTGNDSGFTNGNIYEQELSEKYRDSDVNDLTELVIQVIDGIEVDKKRISQNNIAKNLRANTKEENKRVRVLKSKEKIKAENLANLLKDNNIKNAKSLSDIKDIAIIINTIIIHPKFGPGVVVDANEKISSVIFNGEIKKLANTFIKKCEV